MKKIFFLLWTGCIMMLGINACQNVGYKGGEDKIVSVDSFLKSPEYWANKDIVIKGTVSHICRHTGQKIFLYGDNQDNTLKVVSGGEITKFDTKLEGLQVEIQGKVIEDEKIDEEYLKSWEEEIRERLSEKEVEACESDEKALTGQQFDSTVTKNSGDDPYASVKEFRKKLQESGKSYISIYAIQCKSLKEIKK